MPSEIYLRTKKAHCLKGHDIALVGRVSSGTCKECHYMRNRTWQSNHKENMVRNHKRWYKIHGSNRYWRKISMRDGHLVTAQDYARIYKIQNGKCANIFCNFRGELQLDHDHKTNFFRGLLCGPCNRALGLCKDNTNRLIGLAAYLKETTYAA